MWPADVIFEILISNRDDRLMKQRITSESSGHASGTLLQAFLPLQIHPPEQAEA